MRALSTAVLTAFLGLAVSACVSQKTMESMGSEMSSMDKPMEKSMKDEIMMKDAATDPMKPKMETMDKATQ